MKSEPAPRKIRRRDKTQKREIMFHGIPASPGIVFGTVLILQKTSLELLSARDVKTIPAAQVPRETARFRKAMEETQAEIQTLRDRLQASLEPHEANVFDAHAMIVGDQKLTGEILSVIEKKQVPAEYAYSQVMQKYISTISALPDPYLKERALDIKDVATRLLSHLQGTVRNHLDKLPGPRILAASDLTPSETAMLDREHVLGIATESGSKTSHSALLAHSLHIPAIVGLSHFVECLENGDKLILDGFLGIALLNPEPATIELYEQKAKNQARLFAELVRENQLQSETTDGYRIQLAANVESTDGLADVKRFGAAGIGLFRTEYLYMNREQLPDEAEQFEVYKKVAESVNGQPVIIRTLDLGGDKLAKAIGTFQEKNPFLGLRAIRLCLARPDIFKTQLRAILRAGCYGNIKMMFPMICSVAELDRAMAIVDEVKSDLQDSNMRFAGSMDIGIMIEIPSAALMADIFAKKVDFFSLGTNDLVQYTLAIDRNNEHVANLYEPTNPAVLRLIANTASAAEKNGIWTGVCGEMASDLRYIPILIGLGVEELSMSPIAIGHARRLIRKISMADAERIAAQALQAPNAKEALRYSTDYLERNMPEILAAVREG